EIFEAFKHADGSTSMKYGGSGLGLSISKQLAELLGGSIGLSSKIAKGSIFTLSLPLIYQADSPQLQLASIQQSSKPQSQPFPAPEIAALAAVDVQSVATAAVNLWLKDDRGDLQESDKTLLLIEDDRAFSKILIDLIHKVNFKVLTTDKGRDGILLAQQYLPAAILLDLGLPDINGLRVLEQLKQNLQTRHIPVHVISAADKKIQSQNLGAISYLQKPAQPEAITSTLIEIYANKQPLKKKVLVIEDDSDCAQQIKQLIAGRDTQLLFSESVEDACQQLNAGDFDCIILDLEFSDMNATELVTTISEHARAKEVPIIIYTGQNFSDAQNRILNQFSDSIVIKGSESPERLLDDVTLFLHCLGNQYSNQQQQALQLLHDENEMLLGRRVLVVDDDMRNVFAITRILEQAGIQVTQAQNGAVAVELLSGLNPAIELILMDIMMPVMDGYQAMGLIREMPDYQTTPIIALTAKAMPEDRQKCIDAGACEYLTKPLDMDRVLAMLRVWLYR
ncbi:MAG: response regulator, partial [Pseudomonadales bacterium]|nr:response regulator [Pseudomonadales bacterium]